MGLSLGAGSGLLWGAALAETVAANREMILRDENFAKIEGGTFTMGSPDGDSNERPTHEATLSTFHLEKNQVTNKAYFEYLNLLGTRRFALIGAPEGGVERLLALGKSKSDVRAALTKDEVAGLFPDLDLNMVGKGPTLSRRVDIIRIEDYVPWTGYPFTDFKGPMKPALGLNWYLAFVCAAFCGGALPTEWDIEYAGKVFPGGVREYATASGKILLYGMLTHQEAHFYASGPMDVDDPVDKSLPNGLRHMAGNAEIWTHNWYGPYPEGPVKDPAGPSTGEYKAVRGNSWGNYDPEHHDLSCLRATVRGYTPTSSESLNIGFRRKFTP